MGRYRVLTRLPALTPQRAENRRKNTLGTLFYCVPRVFPKDHGATIDDAGCLASPKASEPFASLASFAVKRLSAVSLGQAYFRILTALATEAGVTQSGVWNVYAVAFAAPTWNT